MDVHPSCRFCLETRITAPCQLVLTCQDSVRQALRTLLCVHSHRVVNCFPRAHQARQCNGPVPATFVARSTLSMGVERRGGEQASCARPVSEHPTSFPMDLTTVVHHRDGCLVDLYKLRHGRFEGQSAGHLIFLQLLGALADESAPGTSFCSCVCKLEKARRLLPAHVLDLNTITLSFATDHTLGRSLHGSSNALQAELSFFSKCFT